MKCSHISGAFKWENSADTLGSALLLNSYVLKRQQYSGTDDFSNPFGGILLSVYHAAEAERARAIHARRH